MDHSMIQVRDVALEGLHELGGHHATSGVDGDLHPADLLVNVLHELRRTARANQ